MLKERFLKLLLVVLSLAVWAGTANASSPTAFTATTMVQGSATPVTGPLQLIYVLNGGIVANQPLATQAVTVNLVNGATDPSSYTISQAGWPNWLAPIANPSTPTSVGSASPVTVNFMVKQAGLPVPTSYPATYSYTVLFQEPTFADMPVTFQLVLCN